MARNRNNQPTVDETQNMNIASRKKRPFLAIGGTVLLLEQ